MKAGHVFIEEDSRSELARDLATEVASVLRVALAQKSKASLAVPGGTTPGEFLTILGNADLDWSRVAVTLTDERQLAPDHPRSNRRLLNETLFAGRATAARYLALDDPVLHDALPLDAAVLGMGTDMHTASLFPGADRLAEALAEDAPPSVALTAPGAPEARVTLTAQILMRARHRFLLIHGPEKRSAWTRAMAASDLTAAPVRVILNTQAPARVFWAP